MDSRLIAETLFDAYQKSGKSYAELADATGIPKAMVQRYITGNVENIPIERFDALCRVLGLDVAELLGWDEYHRADGKVRRYMTPKQAVLLDAADDLTDKEQETLMAMIKAIRETRRD